jgi:transcriptional regulator with XRE-family HTH domain
MAKPLENLRLARTQQRVSQERLAALIGTSQKMVSRIERGRRAPDAKQRRAIAKALSYTEDFLFGPRMRERA